MEYLQQVEACQLTLRDRVDRCWQRARQLAWPPTCVLCRAGTGQAADICIACEQSMPANLWPCRICAQPLAEGTRNRICGACLKRAPFFERSYVPFRYDYPLDRLIQGLKYHQAVAQGRVLGELLARHLINSRSEPLPKALVPVPLALQRFRERGYNQAHELSVQLRAHLQIPICSDLVARTRETPEQASLDAKARRRNVRGAFEITRRVTVQHVALIDDVVTTGSTVNEVARVLRRAGVQRVEVWAVARAGRA